MSSGIGEYRLIVISLITKNNTLIEKGLQLGIRIPMLTVVPDSRLYQGFIHRIFVILIQSHRVKKRI